MLIPHVKYRHIANEVSEPRRAHSTRETQSDIVKEVSGPNSSFDVFWRL